MSHELKHIERLSQDAIKLRLAELDNEITRLDHPQHQTKHSALTQHPWNNLSKRLSLLTGAKADRFKKLSNIEASWAMARFYQRLNEPALHQRYITKCKRLIQRQIIEDTLMCDTPILLTFACQALNAFSANIQKKYSYKLKQP